MNFCYRISIIAFYNIEHLLLAQLPTLVAVGINAGIGTEMAGENTDIGGFDMKIAVEIGLIAVAAFAYVVSQGSEEGERTIFE